MKRRCCNGPDQPPALVHPQHQALGVVPYKASEALAPKDQTPFLIAPTMHPPCQPPPPPQCAPYTPPAPPPAPEPHAQVPSTLGEASGNGAAPAAPVENEVPLTPAPEDVAPLDVPTFGDLSDLILPVTSVVLAATCVIGLQQLGSLLGSISDAIKVRHSLCG